MGKGDVKEFKRTSKQEVVFCGKKITNGKLMDNWPWLKSCLILKLDFLDAAMRGFWKAWLIRMEHIMSIAMHLESVPLFFEPEHILHKGHFLDMRIIF